MLGGETGETQGVRGKLWEYRPLWDVSRANGSLGQVSQAWSRGREDFFF